jgi:hypothetical protein
LKAPVLKTAAAGLTAYQPVAFSQGFCRFSCPPKRALSDPVSPHPTVFGANSGANQPGATSRSHGIFGTAS